MKLEIAVIGIVGLVSVLVEVGADGFSLQGLKKNLFSMQCSAEEEHLYSDWTICAWPHGDLRRLITTFVRDARTKSCKMPPKQMVRIALRSLKDSSYKEHPLYKKVPTTECGFCGRKAQCCRKARSFLFQSFRSESCSENSTPCETDPMSEETINELREWYPDVEASADTCNFSPYIQTELTRLKGDRAFQYIKPLFCQIVGTTKPSISCTRVGDKCRCCCVGYKYEDGVCVVDEETPPDPEC